MTTNNEPKKSKAGRKQFDGRDPKEVLTKLEQGWAVGASDVQAALLANITPMSLSRYLHSHPAISLRKAALLNTTGLKAKIALANAIPSNPELALKYLERREPKEYAPLNRTANTDNEGNNLAPVFDKAESKL
jgi:hypothetical protein